MGMDSAKLFGAGRFDFAFNALGNFVCQGRSGGQPPLMISKNGNFKWLHLLASFHTHQKLKYSSTSSCSVAPAYSSRCSWQLMA
jgi:hypothetical protein